MSFLVSKTKSKKFCIVCLQKLRFFAQNVKHGGPQTGSDYQKTIHATPARWSTECSFGTPDVDRVSFGVRSLLAMILGAVERGDAQLSPGSNQVENF